MTDLKKEIPQRAFINAEILQIAESTGNFRQAMQEITQKYGLSDYVYKNPAYIVSLLYCLIVVPKEIFVDENDLDRNTTIRGQEIAGFFTFKIDEKNHEGKIAKDDSFQLLRRIRNSLAHVNYEVDENMTFTFRDRPSSKKNQPPKPWTFEATIDRNNLMEFISKAGSILANLRTNPL